MEEQVRGPMQALLDDLADEFGHLRMLRPHRDARSCGRSIVLPLAVSA